MDIENQGIGIISIKHKSSQLGAGNFWIVDIEINAWSRSFVNLQINSICIRYPMKSVVCGKNNQSEAMEFYVYPLRENVDIQYQEIQQILRLIQKCPL